MLRTTLILTALVGVLVFTGAAAPALEQDLSGVYACHGVNPDGSPYQGIVEIANQNGSLQLQWIFEGEVAAVGMGIRSGNVLAVAHYTGVPGVVAYKIEEGNRLVGEWTVAGADGALFSETLTKLPPQKRETAPQRLEPAPQDRESSPRTPRSAPARGTREL